MIYILVGVIILLLVLLIAGFVVRKNYYKEIDKLETWKIELVNKPVLEELSKVKQLNMTGQTENLFEEWRTSWDEIVSVDLPKIEDLLFEAEESTDKYRFQSSKRIQEKIRHAIKSVETKMDHILTEVTHLISSSEKNSEEIIEVQEQFKSIKKQLLIHRHQYGQAITQLEAQLEGLQQAFTLYEEKTVEGNYLEAREIVTNMVAEMDGLSNKIHSIPELMTEVSYLQNTQLKELEDGYVEMMEQGFVLTHLQLDTELAVLKELLTSYHTSLLDANTDEVEDGINELKETIESIYQLLEQEAEAKLFISRNENAVRELLLELKNSNQSIAKDTEFLQTNYEVEQNLDTPYQLDKIIQKLSKRFEQVHTKILDQEVGYSILSEELKDIRKQLDEVKAQQKVFAEYIKTLRKDEIESKESVKILQKKVQEMKRMLQRSNLPGVPASYIETFENVEEKIDGVLQSLSEQPLNMNKIQSSLREATEVVDQLFDQTTSMIDQVQLIEKIIQYGNRYRSTSKNLSEGLQEAEALFRKYDYEKALEQAAAAVQKVDPNALKHIEEQLNQ